MTQLRARLPIPAYLAVIAALLGSGNQGRAIVQAAPAAHQLAAPLRQVAGANRVFLPRLSQPGYLYIPLVSQPPRPTMDLTVSRVEVIQGTTMNDAYTVHIASRPAILRVFVALAGAGSQAGVRARLTRIAGGVPQDALMAGPATIQATTNEGDLAQTVNFSLPGHWLAPGTSYVLELDPDNVLAEMDEGNNRFPAGGDRPFDFVNAPVLDVVIVPVRYKGITPATGDLSYLTWMPPKVFPISQVNYSVRPAFTFTYSGSDDLRTINGWFDLLNDLTAFIHAPEDPSELKVYYGLVDSVAVDGCSGGCYVGIGWVNAPWNPAPGQDYISKTAVGFAGFPPTPERPFGRQEASGTFTHEMGHNFGRYHAPCGSVDGVDPGYPYGGALIGQWGYDTGTGSLIAPTVYRDFMSYCDPEWTSDYTYRGIYDAFAWATNPFGTAAGAAAERQPAVGPVGAVITGYVDEAGLVHTLPRRGSGAAPFTTQNPSGPYHLRLLDAQGRLLAETRFSTVPFALDRSDGGSILQAFSVAMPAAPEAVSFQITSGGRLMAEEAVAP